MIKNLPRDYKPLKKLVVCSNTLTGGGQLISMGNDFPLLIGSGSTPNVWLKALANTESNDLVSVVEKNKSKHHVVRVKISNNKVTILVAGETILSVKATSMDVMIVEKLDFRPLGLNIYGDKDSFSVGGNSFSNNTMNGGGTLIALGD
ncbi:hypothetical protein AB4499_21115 [Vibrio cyclitrophicus]